MLWLMLRWLNVSDAAAKIATSRDAGGDRALEPRQVRHQRRVADARPARMPAKTSPASAICGTHFGLTNAATSITGSPAALKRSTNATLSAVLTEAASFCSPSRGPTSTTVTRGG